MKNLVMEDEAKVNVKIEKEVKDEKVVVSDDAIGNQQENEHVKKHRVGTVVVRFLAAIAIFGIALLAYNKIMKPKTEEYQGLPVVNIAYMKKGDINNEISVMGTIVPSDTYYVSTKVDGDIKKIYVEVGDKVKKGDPICDIDTEKATEAAFIQYDTAKKTYERMENLYKAGDISLQSFETVKAQYDAAKLSYDTQVEYSTPVAVGDGVVESTNMTLNTAIKKETVICYITSNDAKKVSFAVTERVLPGIKINDKVIIEKNNQIYEAYISEIANLINSQGLFDVKAIITSENNFASGIMAKVTFTYQKKENVDILPNEYVYYEAGNPYIFTVTEDNMVTKKYIEVGMENRNWTEVLSGIDNNTKIVSTWNNDLAEGAYVQINNEEVARDVMEAQ